MIKNQTFPQRAFHLDPAWRWSLGIFAFYRVLHTLWAAWISSGYPRYPAEQAVSVLPPSLPLGAWLERVILLPNVRYDVLWYVGIAEQGYTYRAGSTAFHPLYPLLGSVLGQLFGGATLFALWLVAQICCVGMLVVLYRLVALDYGDETARFTTLLLMGGPLGSAFLIPYTESLLLACVAGSLLAARQGRWWVAGIAAAGAALTKQPGAVVVLSLLWIIWQTYGSELRNGRWQPMVVPILALGCVPLALVGWFIYRAWSSDLAFDFSSPSSFISGLLVTPSYADVWQEYFDWPWMSIPLALWHFDAQPSFYTLFNVIMVFIGILLTIYSIMRLRREYALYSAALVIMNLAIIYPFSPYMGIVRRFTIIFPIFLALALLVQHRLARFATMVICSILWLYVTTAYVRNAFVP